MLKEKVESVISKDIRPGLQMDGGDVELVNVDESTGTVKVRLQGHCASCPMAQMTVVGFVERVLKERVQGVKRVEAV